MKLQTFAIVVLLLSYCCLASAEEHSGIVKKLTKPLTRVVGSIVSIGSSGFVPAQNVTRVADEVVDRVLKTLSDLLSPQSTP